MKIKNLLFQPVITILKNGNSLHLGPRKIITIKSSDVSDHIYALEMKGIVKLTTEKSKKSKSLNKEMVNG